MSGKGWHITRSADALILARRLPVRFDIVARTTLPDLRRVRLAHQMRQDVWRALRDIRGFSPVIELRRNADGLAVRAGGRVDGPVPRGVPERIAAVLDNPANRARWIAHSRRRAA